MNPQISRIIKTPSVQLPPRDVPTIIVGMGVAEQLIPSFTSLRKTYEDGMLRWTYSKTERRSDYERDMAAFYCYCVDHVGAKTDFSNIPMHTLNRGRIRNLIKWLDDDSCIKMAYVCMQRYLFIYCPATSCEYGFSLSTSEFYGISIESIINHLQRLKGVVMVDKFRDIPKEYMRDAYKKPHILLPLLHTIGCQQGRYL